MSTNYLISEFTHCGPNDIDLVKVISKWNHLWYIYENRLDDRFTLVKNLRKDSDIVDLKIKIPSEVANNLIDNLSLESIRTTLKHSYTWRRPTDWEFLSTYAIERFKKGI